MATHNITINEQGTPTPDRLMCQRGDEVTFSTVNRHLIFCLPNTVFEKERIDVIAGDSIVVGVKQYAPHGDFDYWFCNTADASGLDCSEITEKRKGDMGGGSVGGGEGE